MIRHHLNNNSNPPPPKKRHLILFELESGDINMDCKRKKNAIYIVELLSKH